MFRWIGTLNRIIRVILFQTGYCTLNFNAVLIKDVNRTMCEKFYCFLQIQKEIENKGGKMNEGGYIIYRFRLTSPYVQNGFCVEELIKIFGMAVLQGVTEFLPVSSSGHLAVANMLFKMENIETASMAVTLHAGTLLSVCIVYWRQIRALFEKKNFRMVLLIAMTLIPTGVIGVMLELTGWNDRLSASPIAVGCGFLVTASLLWFCLKPAKSNASPGLVMSAISFSKAFWIGLAQGVAVLSGISRSGSTISAAVGVGMRREDAAAFSFLISIPAICGAVGVKMLSTLKHIYKDNNWEGHVVGGGEVLVLAFGFAVAAIVGYFSLRGLIKLLQGGKLRYFAIYCFILGVVVITCGLMGKGDSDVPAEDAVPAEVIHE